MKLIKQINNYLKSTKSFISLYEKVFNLIDGDFNLSVQGLYGSSKSSLIASLFEELEENADFSLFVVCSTSKEAEETYDDIKAFSKDESNIFLFPDWETIPYEHISPFQDIIHYRINVLHNLLVDKPKCIVAPVKSLMRHIIPKDIFNKEYLYLKVDEDIDYNNIIKQLIELGYTREDKTYEPGTFSLKGFILDIFPSSLPNPVRIELFGDTVDSIRTFDATTQKSIEDIKQVEILPQKELILTDDYVINALSILEDRFAEAKDYKEISEKISQKIYFQGIEQYLPFFYEVNTILDYIDDSFIFVFDEPEKLKRASKSILHETQTLFEQSHKKDLIKPSVNELFTDFEFIYESVNKVIETFMLVHLEENDFVKTIKVNSPSTYMSDFKLLENKIKEAFEEKKHLFILANYEGQAKRITHIVSELGFVVRRESEVNKLTNDVVYIGEGELKSSFGLDNLLFILDREIRGKKRSVYKKIRKVNSAPLESYLDLKSGDLVVHINYGIGRYKGIERITANDKQKDFILVIYADKEKLYVPLEQLNLVQKYIGAETAKLDKLGGKGWERTKARVKRSVEELAHELLQIYSARAKLQGYAFGPDSKWQQDFEYAFEYEETPDQLKTIEDVKKDMESIKPMDRLICGDVGYGKTEVAMRAAFKAIMDGKQTAILVPTTILCEQHFVNFKERFKNFPITIEMLSRFRSTAESKEIIKKVNEGKIDIIIGTHKLLSKSIKFKNLGLVVIDEEQRFGVKHKEKLKTIRKLVDVITLSATPIPRTLHMSMANIRDLSIINTPPENRLPIETYTMEFNDDIIKMAIKRELKRDGQVFFVFNRVQTIKEFAIFLMKLIPSLRVCVAHGQMEEKDLEKIMLDFINKKYDVMVCTTIIESGMDIPNVNTILIDRADRLGLAQLYQLRGRVGRSKKQAYCYLFYPADKAISEVAAKRLSAINEFTDLGSGLKISLRDMEIRGAGNVLGPEQSGNICAVGFDLYCKLLNETVLELSTGEKQVEFETYVDLKYDGYIPDEYVKDENQKIEVYKKIASCESIAEIEEVRKEVQDRFGPLPAIVADLLKISEIKALGNRYKIPSIIEMGQNVVIEFNENSQIVVDRIWGLIKANEKQLFVSPDSANKLFMKISDFSLDNKLNFIKKIILNLKREKE